MKLFKIQPCLFVTALAFALVSGIGTASGQDCNALVDALVRKQILTPQEGDNVRADLIHENRASDKITVGNSVKQLSLYGDLRLRYEYFNLDPQFEPGTKTGDPGHGTQSSRFRFRLRLNADFKLTDNWFGGVQLTTAKSPDTGSQSFQGAFQNYDIFISRAYVGWKNSADWLTLVGGKQPNPFYSTDLMWDPNINPDGFTEQVQFHKLFQNDSGKDSHPSPWELTLTTGQLFYDDNLEDGAAGVNTDAWLFEEQLMFSYRLSKTTKLTLAPGFMWWNAARVNNAYNVEPFSQATDGLPPTTGETRGLSIVQVPGDIAFKIAGLSAKFFWDFSYNTAGQERVSRVYGLDGKLEAVKDAKGNTVTTFRRSVHERKDDFGYQVGILLGQNAKRGDWSFYTSYRQVGLACNDPNLYCSDFGLSRLNMKGWKFSVAYNVTDSAVFQVTWFMADNLRKDLVGGQATGGAKIADSNSIQVLCVDLVTKF